MDFIVKLLSNNKLRDLGAAVIREAERRKPECKKLKALHKAASIAERQAYDDGEITTLSSAGGKDNP